MVDLPTRRLEFIFVAVLETPAAIFCSFNEVLFGDKGEALETQSVKSGGLETIEADVTTGEVRLSDRKEEVEAGKVTGVDFMVLRSS